MAASAVGKTDKQHYSIPNSYDKRKPKAGVTMTKKTLAFSLILLVLFVSSGCFGIQMPFNADIQFHDIALTVPERFIRDSSQSKEDLWVFEHDNYSE